MKWNIKKLRDDQAGMVSVIVTMVLIIVMTLVVLAMAQDSNREQRQVLDRQLSEQAFYNAETGINDWRDFIARSLNNSPDSLPSSKTTCDPNSVNGSSVAGIPSPVISQDGVNSYSCVLYDLNPEEVSLGSMDQHVPARIPIQPLDGNVGSVTVVWDNTGYNVSGCSSVTPVNIPPSLPGGCVAGGAHIQLSPLAVSRESFSTSNFSAYFLPNETSGPDVGRLNYAAGIGGNQGALEMASCDASSCRATIVNLPSNVTSANPYFLTISGFYNKLNFTAFYCASTTSCEKDSQKMKTQNTQLELDVTGKASDVLRRLQIRYPIGVTKTGLPDFALSTAMPLKKCVVVSEVGTPSATSGDDECIAN